MPGTDQLVEGAPRYVKQMGRFIGIKQGLCQQAAGGSIFGLLRHRPIPRRIERSAARCFFNPS
jgi:hypothetical protein